MFKNISSRLKNISSPKLHFINDVNQIQSTKILEKVQVNSHFSLSFIILLTGSTIVCTLGLLLNAPSVVIGGMIISPLMWPLMKISLGISYEKALYIKQAMIVLILSIIIAFASSFLITVISPIKLINGEILARTTPTLLDVIVALVAGGIATLAITQPRISESLAGVAIATSLLPPLCVSGIGLAVLDYSTFWGGLILFLANVISIIFISIITFSFIGIRRESDTALRNKGFLFTAIMLLVTAIPLFFFLKSYSFKIVAYHKVQEILHKSLIQLSPSIYIDSVKTTLQPSVGNNILIEAEVWLPEDLTVDYKQQQKIVENLERSLGKKVDLHLRLQRTISIISQQDRLQEIKRKILENTFIDEIQKINESFSIDSLEVNIDTKTDGWFVKAVLRGDPSIGMTQNQREILEKLLSDKVGEKVLLNLEIISRIQLQSNPEIENQQIEKEIQRLIKIISEDIDITSMNIRSTYGITQPNNENNIISVDIVLTVPYDYELQKEAFDYLKSQLKNQFKSDFEFTTQTVEKRIYKY